MPISDGTAPRLDLGGLVIAAVGFGLTRYAVLESLRSDVSLVGFLVSEVLALVAGFGLTAFGVWLAISSHDPSRSRLVAGWCLLGTAGMGVVVVLTYAADWPVALSTTESRLIANALVGGAVGGTLTGVRSAATRRHRRDVARQADRLTVLNRLLRHEVLNKVNVVAGYATTSDGSTGDAAPNAWATVRQHADAIDETIENVGLLTESPEPQPVDLAANVREAADAVRAAHPDGVVELGSLPDVPVRGVPHLDVLFEHLLENAIVHGDRQRPTVWVRVEADDSAGVVRVHIVDDGPGLPPSQQRLVRGAVAPEEDDPQVGFGLAIVRLMLDDIGGRLAVETPAADGRGTALTVTLPRSDAPPDRSGIASGYLRCGVIAGLIAGGAMGLVTQFVANRMAIIGALYGVDNAAVGWVIHQYHSVFFALVFVAATASWVRDTDSRRLVTLGAGYGAVLWLVAAGLVMPLWLRAVGIPAPVPNLGLPSLLNHLLWGSVFGGVYAWLLGR
ncbi:MAG: HAMP domain-containing sensor histidine kinase [Haloplanus sp.]